MKGLLSLLAFPLFALVFVPFVATYIGSEHGPDHTPDWGLAFGVEAAWIVFLLLVLGIIGAVANAREKKDGEHVALGDEQQAYTLVEVLQALEEGGDHGVPSRRVAPAAAARLLKRGYIRKERGCLHATRAGLQALSRWEEQEGT